MSGAPTIVMIFALFHSGIYLKAGESDASSCSIYSSAFSLLVAALTLGYLSNHLAMPWVFTEVTTLSAALLIYHHRNKTALEGTWKYIFVCAISVTFVFIGILLMSLSLLHAGSSDMSYAAMKNCAADMDPFWMRLGFIFIFVGYTAKMGLFPMFTAGIDAKDNAPSPAAALLASVLVNLGFVGIFRAYAIVSATPVASWSRVMMVAVALITLFVATAYMIKIGNIKRMLAYSGIEHMSLVTLGLAMGKAGCFAAILHLLMHTFVKSGLFFHFTQLYRAFRSKLISEMGGYLNINGFGAVVLLLGFVSITAVPPSGLFVSEFLIFKSLYAAGSYVVLGVTVMLLTVLIWAFARSLFKIVFIPLPEKAAGHDATFCALEYLSPLILFCLAIYIGYNPPVWLTELINQAVSSLGQYGII